MDGTTRVVRVFNCTSGCFIVLESETEQRHCADTQLIHNSYTISLHYQVYLEQFHLIPLYWYVLEYCLPSKTEFQAKVPHCKHFPTFRFRVAINEDFEKIPVNSVKFIIIFFRILMFGILIPRGHP